MSRSGESEVSAELGEMVERTSVEEFLTFEGFVDVDGLAEGREGGGGSAEGSEDLALGVEGFSDFGECSGVAGVEGGETSADIEALLDGGEGGGV